MSKDVFPLSVEDRLHIKMVLGSSSDTFSVLAGIADLDPAGDFRFLDLSGVDFSGSDLRGFDFTGANLARTNWTDAIYDDTTIVRDALMDSAIGFVFRKLRPENSTPALRHLKKGIYQATLRSAVSITGVGVHSGLPIVITIGPGPTDTGFVFHRSDVGREVRAAIDSVVTTQLATVLGDQEGPLVSSAEIILAPLRGLGIDNAIIELDGPEVPIMDGSAAAYVAAIDQAEVIAQSKPRRFIQVLKPVQVAIGDSFGEIRPHSGFRVEVEIYFSHPQIGQQNFNFDLTPESFRIEVSRARTFGSMNDVARLWSAGFALGATIENSVVFDETRIINSEGLRYPDEFARHKALDVIGDFALAGLPLLCAYRSIRGGHRLNHTVLSALMADKSAWRVVDVGASRDRSSTHGSSNKNRTHDPRHKHPT
jgi:UDP-3-O-[3-hydroxymyristoyl] N-acetylglucosamine deacetylase